MPVVDEIVDAEGEACPVCRWPIEEQDRCDRCAWTLTSGFRLGWPTAADLARFDDELLAAQRCYDLAMMACAGLGGEGVAPAGRAPLPRGDAPSRGREHDPHV